MTLTGELNSSSKAQPDLASYFDRSAAAVRQYSDRFEKSYGTPAVNYCVSSFDAYPISSAFVGTFACLSFFPVITFIGISAFVITFFTLVAFSCALGAIIVVELGLLSIIATVLTATFFISIPLTGAAIFTYLFARFLLHLRSSGREGAVQWVDETRQHFLKSKSPARTPRNDRSSEGSEELPFLVNNGQIEADSQRSDE